MTVKVLGDMNLSPRLGLPDLTTYNPGLIPRSRTGSPSATVFYS
jgi:hypothetical protein